MSVSGCACANWVAEDVAQTDMANQSVALEFDEHSQRFRNRSLRWAFEPSYPKIDNIETFNAEISQVVMNAMG